MPDNFPFLPPGTASTFPYFEDGSFWFLLKKNNQDFHLQRTWGDLDDQQREQLIDEALYSERCHQAFKRCCESNSLQHLDQTFMSDGLCCHCDIELVPVMMTDASVDIIGHIQMLSINQPEQKENRADSQAIFLPLLNNVNQHIAQAIKSLKTSVYLLNKADKAATRCYFHELADANMSKIECLVDDVSLFYNLVKREETSIFTQFSLSAIIDDIQISRQGLLSQRNIGFSVDMGNLSDHYLVGDGDCFMLLFNKLFDLVVSWNDRGTVRLSCQIEQVGNNNVHLHVSFYSHCIRLPVGVEVSDLDNLLRASYNESFKATMLPLLDMLICRQIIENINGRIRITQSAAMDMMVALDIPIHTQS